MRSRLTAAYRRLRAVPIVGLLASRLVWAVKGALGRPVRWGPADPAPAAVLGRGPVREAQGSELPILFAIASAALDGLDARTGKAAPRPTVAPSAGAPPSETPGVSVVVNTYDRAPHLRRTLQGLSQLRYPAFEVIAVNGPSTDDTETVLAEFAGCVRLAHCADANLAASRNIGLAMARGEIVAFIDDDAVPEPDWLDQLVGAFADPRVAGAGGFIRDRSGVSFQCQVVVADRFGGNENFPTLEAADLPPGGAGPERFLSLTGANCAFRREALAAVGGFDEAYTYFLEETDVCLRLVEAGWSLTAAPFAEVHHAFAESHLRYSDHTPRSLLPSVRSTAYFAMRHALSGHGLAAVAQHLSTHAGALQASVRRRAEAGPIAPDHRQRLEREIIDGLAEGVRQAVAEPAPAAHVYVRSGDVVADLVRRHKPRREPDRRLRLCLTSQQYPPGPTGGIAVWTRALARGLAHAGHEVTVLTRSNSSEPSVRYDEGVWVHRLASRRHDAPAEAGLLADPDWADTIPPVFAGYSAALLQEVRRITPRRRFDLAMGPIWDLEPAALLADGQLPTVVSLHTTYALAAPFQPDWADPAFRAGHVDPVIAAERRMLARARHLLANSDAVVEDLARAYGLADLARRCHVIPHGLPDYAKAGKRGPRPDDGWIEVLFVGRLEPRKGGDVLLEAAARVLRIEPCVRVVVVGDDQVEVGGETLRSGFQRRFARSGVLDRISFTGPLDQEALLDRYAACDLFVAPSRYESFGLVFVEAMMFAKPCIGCQTGGIGEVLADGETGLLVQPGDVVGLSAAIMALVHDPERRRAMGRAGRRRYETRFTARAMVQAAERFFDAVKRDYQDSSYADAGEPDARCGLQPSQWAG